MQTQVRPAWLGSIQFAILSMISLLKMQSICLSFRIIKARKLTLNISLFFSQAILLQSKGKI